MSDPLPALEPGLFYHIYNRGNGGENIFRETRNYNYFLTLHSKHIPRVADTYAYCLLKNHFHLLVRIKPAEVLKGIKPERQFSNWFSAYAQAYNIRYQRHGSLFQRPFRRIPVLTDSYLVNLVHYIHRNPQKHGFVSDFREWEYSSYHLLSSTKSTYLKRQEIIEWFGTPASFIDFHSQRIDENKFQDLIGEDLD